MASSDAVQPIDTHVHFWDLATYQGFDSWFAGRAYLRRDYLPHHLQPELDGIGARGAIIVGAAPDCHRHNLGWGRMCEEEEGVVGLVASYSLASPQLEVWLNDYAGKRWFLGIRSQPATSPDEWGSDSVADQGARALLRRSLVLDILVDHHRLPAVCVFARKHADLPFVVNHCGLPPFVEGDLQLWERNVRELAGCANVVMKYSSFLLHCHPRCDPHDLRHAAEVLFDSFGTKRLLWGSNWPPELVGGTYREAFDTMLGSAPALSDDERNQVLALNASRVYGLQL